ncbi:MAG: hypothetical protein K5790_05835 [Nitrosopumilus sp.]|uniref:hypothetical protein n=1 Tax=Nitrosopumilus sp. TaxID=2024843 RepID=UPI00247B887F|nr:hypothetical protein [Nitrosopumilus sp.]MCV0392801.1 hypothetical protein [Nitrosopumilus sp.]
MRTRFLIISGILALSFVIANSSDTQYAHAGCTATILPQPCFDSFRVSHVPLTEELIMDSIYGNIDTNYKGWTQTDRNWSNNDEGYDHPTIICTAFDWKGQTHYRMLQWKDDYRISSLEDYRNDSMCDKWFPPKSLDAANPSFDCREAVKNQIPTDWKYNCYDEPLANPLRDISLSNPDDPQRLEFILKHCERHGPLDYVGQLRFLNDTHLIDLDTCKWDTRTNSGVSLDRTVYSQPLSEEKSEQAKALCESDDVILKDGVCVKIENDCRVYYILDYAIDDCNNHIPIFLILSALILICATGAFIYTWRRK